MKIYHCSGFECEKQLPTTLEDLFNQSDVLYDIDGSEKKLNVTYVRYFDQYLKEQAIYNEEETGVPFYHIAALLILMKHGGQIDASRLYYNDTKEFMNAFNTQDIPEAISIFKSK
ncbi:hypothetical protein [Caldalkalibacillus mannanilyticus]|uniref:hypothetical protein n=1 Tax=Caldalkalibacillus mannanilyticus TaxID=1418 RepID=UPI00046A244A|nr:hypothetical protein [Caldalkalibacillus mannanilyticus]